MVLNIYEKEIKILNFRTTHKQEKFILQISKILEQSKEETINKMINLELNKFRNHQYMVHFVLISSKDIPKLKYRNKYRTSINIYKKLKIIAFVHDIDLYILINHLLNGGLKEMIRLMGLKELKETFERCD